MEYRCTICIKTYKSYQSLWNHNKKFHNNLVKNSKEKVKNSKEILSNIQIEDKIYNCKFCNKFFSYKQSRYDHEKKLL